MGVSAAKAPHTGHRDHIYLTLDGLRGVAAGAILVRHCPALFGANILENSQLAVDLFFVLSGFVIAHAYEARLTGAMGTAQFMRLRIIRLYPLYLLGTVVGVLVGLGAILLKRSEALTPALFVGTTLLALLMLPAPPAAGTLFPLNSPAWSLAFELVGNAAFVLLLRTGLLGRRGLITTTALGGVALVITTILYGGVGGGFEWQSAPAGAARVAFSFFAGVGLYRLRDRWPRIPKIPAVALALILVGMFAIRPPAAWGLIYQLTVTIVGFPALVFMSARVQPAPALAPGFRVLGVTSYGIYALHKPLEELFVGACTAIHIPITEAAPWAGWIFFAAMISAVAPIHRYLDTPVRAWATGRLAAPPRLLRPAQS